jgi:pyruvate ferredoxin oxidoreductase alpha subunit
MTTVNRALSGPTNIHCDHSDTMGGRDSGWIQLYGEDHQQAYDNCIQAIRIAEHMDVRTPVMHMYDGYVISGAIGPLVMLEDKQVQDFIGSYHAINPLLDVENPVTVGPFDGLHGWYFEHKVSQNRAMERALAVIQNVADEFAELSGRQYGLLDPYRLKDAEIAIVVIGSTAGAVRMTVDKLRARGVKAGMVRVRAFRPFPHAAYAKALEHVKVVGVLDRADSFGAQGGPLFLEVRCALYDSDPRPQILPFIYGLGGRDIFPDTVEEAFAELEMAAQGRKRASTERRYLNLRKD